MDVEEATVRRDGNGGVFGGECTGMGLRGSSGSPRGGLAGAGSQNRGLSVQDMGLVLVLMLHKA